jgi:hypothetical protein
MIGGAFGRLFLMSLFVDEVAARRVLFVIVLLLFFFRIVIVVGAVFDFLHKR